MILRWTTLLVVLSLLGASVWAFTRAEKPFEPPNEARRRGALGDTTKLDRALRRALEPDLAFFPPIPKPKSGDWLAEHHEAGQTFDAFRKDRRRPRLDRKRRTLYLQPLGLFDRRQSKDLEAMRRFAEAYFSLPVKVRQAALLAADKKEGVKPEGGERVVKITEREHGPSGRQLLTGDILAWLKRDLPKDAFCVVAVTHEDLYPDPDWNFVFGQASLRSRIGVYSFARFRPDFFEAKKKTQLSEAEQRLFLKRSCAVLAHETLHIFGLAHCVHFLCIENGSNHLRESDSRPLHLCPVCLRKLLDGRRVDPLERYRQLEREYRKLGLEESASWVKRRLQVIQ